MLLLALHALGLTFKTEDSLPKELVFTQLLVEQFGFELKLHDFVGEGVYLRTAALFLSYQFISKSNDLCLFASQSLLIILQLLLELRGSLLTVLDPASGKYLIMSDLLLRHPAGL